MSATPTAVRYFVSVVVFVGLGYMLWSSMGSYELQEQVKREAAAAKSNATKQAVLRMAASSSAVIDWPRQLASDQQFRMSLVQTAELQSLWITQKPILFIGRVEDIARSTLGRSLVTVTFDDLGQSHTFMGTRLQIRVECPEAVVEQLFNIVSRPDYLSLGADAALVATVIRIDRSEGKNEGGSIDRVLVGVGTCSDAVHLPAATRW